MSFKELDEFFDDALRLPVGGKTYVVPGVDAETGLWCQHILDKGKAVHRGDAVDETLDDDDERSLYQRVLGSAYDEMIADGLSWNKIKHCGMTAFFWAAGNQTTAEKYWESGGDPEALTPPATNRAQRRASGSRTKTGGAAATTSRKRVSTNGTKNRA